MAISTVQTTSGNTGASYVNFTTSAWTGNNTAGNFLVLAIATSNPSTSAVLSVIDTAGNIWIKETGLAGSAAVPNALSLDVWYVANCLSGITPTITITMAVGQFNTISYVAREYSGIALTAPVDVSASLTETNFFQTHAIGATATTTQASELVISAYSYTSSGETLTASAGYTTVVNQSNATQFTGIGFTDQVLSSTGTQTCTFTSVSFVSGLGRVITFKAATTVTPISPAGLYIGSPPGFLI